MQVNIKNFNLVIEWTRYMTIGIDERNIGVVLNWYSHDFHSAANPEWRKKRGIMLTLFLGIAEWCVEVWHIKEDEG
jgi:hypothetical protein